MFPWKYDTIHASDVFPRQFEYHPNYQDVILYGTQDGKVGIISTSTRTVTPLGVFGQDPYDPILGLCWFRKENSKFVVGSSCGELKYAELTLDKDPSVTPLTRSYAHFPHLSSVHINSEDSQLVVSGTTKNVTVYDLKTGQTTVEMKMIHSDSINISRFSNRSPTLLATCSFDTTIKLWDLRVPHSRGPIQCMQSKKALVMVNFSPNDAFILSAGSDNEVHQFVVANGEKDLTFDIPKRHSSINFTRAYYSSSGKYIASGGSEEDCINILSSATGSMICSVPLFPGSVFPSPYVQSLRLCPQSDNHMTVLLNDRVIGQRQLVHIEVTSSRCSQEGCANSLSTRLTSGADVEEQRGPSYALAATGARRAQGSDEEVEPTYTQSLLPPTDLFIKSLDKLWFRCISGTEHSAMTDDGWRDGVIYLTYFLPSDIESSISEAHSRTSFRIWCSCRGVEDWKKYYSLCIPVHPAVICARNPVLSELINISIDGAMKESYTSTEGPAALGCCGRCSSQALAVSLDCVISLDCKIEKLIFANCILRYLYSGIISIDMLIKIATSSSTLDIIMSESLDSEGLPSDFRNSYIDMLLDVLDIAYRLSVKLCVEEMQLHLDCIIGSLLRVQTFQKIMEIAVKYDRNQLLDQCTRFLATNFENIYSSAVLSCDEDSIAESEKCRLRACRYFLTAVQSIDNKMLLLANVCINVVNIVDSKWDKTEIVRDRNALSLEIWWKILKDVCSLFEPSLNADTKTGHDDAQVPEKAGTGLELLDCPEITGRGDDNSSSDLLGYAMEIVDNFVNASGGGTEEITSESESSTGDYSIESFQNSNDATDESDTARVSSFSASSVIRATSLSAAERAPRGYGSGTENMALSPEMNGPNEKFGPNAIIVSVPSVFGHSSVLVFNDFVLNFGGRNNHALFGNDLLLAFYPSHCKWKYVQTFGNVPPMLNNAVALPLESENTRHVLFIDDKYGKWSFSVLDCLYMMWRSVKINKDEDATLCRRHRATIAAVPPHSCGYAESTSSRQWSYAVIWGGYSFDTQQSRDDVCVVKVRVRCDVDEGAQSKEINEAVDALPLVEESKEDIVGDSGGGLFSESDETPLPLLNVKSSCADMKLHQIGRIADAMVTSGIVELTCIQPLVTGNLPPPRWGSSSALMHAPSGVRMIIHGGVGQIEGMISDDVFSLRCGNPVSMQWDITHITGMGPGIRYGHSMSNSSTGSILVYGGCVLSASHWRFREADDNNIYCLEYVSSDFNSICLRWSSITPVHSAPCALRLKHTAVLWQKSLTVEQLIVFGGVNQSGGINGDICLPERGVQRFNITKRGSRSISGAVGLIDADQKIVFVNGTPQLFRSHYTLHETFRELLSSGFLSDLNIYVEEKGDGFQEQSLSQDTSVVIAAHSALVGMHSMSLSSSVGWARSHMEARSGGSRKTTKALHLDPEICGNVDIANQFLIYLYSGIPDLNPSNVLQMAAVADLYVIDALYRHCEVYLLLLLQINNACELLHCIDGSFVFSKMSSLRATAVSFVVAHFEELKDTPEYLLLSDEVKMEIINCKAVKL